MNEKQSGLFPAGDTGPINAAVFEGGPDHSDLVQALTVIGGTERRLIVSDSGGFHRDIRAFLRLSSAEIGLDTEQLDSDLIVKLIRRWAGETTAGTVLIVDMRWVVKIVQGAGTIENWGLIAEKLAADLGLTVISRYDRELLVDDQVQASFRAHRQFLAASGLYENPFWLPAEIRRAPKGEQMSFQLGRVVPEFAGTRFFERDDKFAARGADPDWLVRPKGLATSEPEKDAWQIYCFGQLRVYQQGNRRIDWKTKGGAPKKTRTLFAYLLTKGEKGAHADRIAELLWPEGETEHGKRARLHHTIAMLRKTLGDKNAVLRGGDYYRLNAPEGSWIDITSFEQLCRRGVSLFKRGQREEALQIYRTAEELYAGDLFQDIPVEYTEDEQEDWCLPRRVWLREMALKLQRDMSALLREEGRLREALEHCQKALAIDPTSEDANTETMRVFHAQGRIDTVARQYRQYRKAMDSIDATADGSEVQALFLALTSR